MVLATLVQQQVVDACLVAQRSETANRNFEQAVVGLREPTMTQTGYDQHPLLPKQS